MAKYSLEVNKDRLSRVINNGFEHWDERRSMREKLLRQVAGSMYFKDDKGLAIPLNLMNTTFYTLSANLVSGMPRLNMTSTVTGLAADARVYGRTVERVWWANCFPDTNKMCVADALAGLSIVKIGSTNSDNAPHYQGFPSPAGIFIDRIDLDDFACDPNARGLKKWTWAANKYGMPLDDAYGIEGADKDKLTKLASGREGDDRLNVTRIGNPDVDSEESRFSDYITLVDCFIPRDQVIVTMGYSPSRFEVVATKDWGGPKHGPYRFLSLNPLPNNVYPVPPLSVIHDLHEAINMHFRKFMSQTARAKTLYGYEPGADDDAVVVQDAKDGAIVKMENPTSVAAIEYKGPSQSMFQESAFMQQLFSQQAGNIDLTAGNGPGAKTLGQSQILMGNIQQRLSAHRGAVNQFCAEIAEDCGYYLHHDPIIDETLTIEDQLGEPMEVYYNPQVRQGSFYDYQFKVKAWQEPYTDEQTKFGRLMQFLVEGIPASYQAEQISEFAISAQRLIRNMAQQIELDAEIADVFRDQETIARRMMEHRQVMMQQQQQEMAQAFSGGGGGKAQTMRSMDRSTNAAPQMAGGRRDSSTVANGKYSSQAMSGSTLGASQAGRQRY